MDALQAREARNSSTQTSNNQPATTTTTFGNSANAPRLNVPAQGASPYSTAAPVTQASPQVVVVNNGNQGSTDHFWTGAFLGYIFGSHHNESRSREYVEPRTESNNVPYPAATPAVTQNQSQGSSDSQNEGSSAVLWLIFVLFTVAGFGLWYILKPKNKDSHYRL